ncbi:unnamed protein product [Linum trigynum]|uniref:Uncharacterized protein n=1 Tax=Linum trigynum TaxID=586398 RepID=A0AAV2GE15_9ROSI
MVSYVLEVVSKESIQIHPSILTGPLNLAFEEEDCSQSKIQSRSHFTPTFIVILFHFYHQPNLFQDITKGRKRKGEAKKVHSAS